MKNLEPETDWLKWHFHNYSKILNHQHIFCTHNTCVWSQRNVLLIFRRTVACCLTRPCCTTCSTATTQSPRIEWWRQRPWLRSPRSSCTTWRWRSGRGAANSQVRVQPIVQDRGCSFPIIYCRFFILHECLPVISWFIGFVSKSREYEIANVEFLS